MKELSIIDRVQTFDDILAISGKTMESIAPPGEESHVIAYKQACLIAEVYNEGTILDPMDTSQPKYSVYGYIDPGSGFGLSCHGYAYWYSHSGVGVRLCFKDRKLAIDAFKKFPNVYANFLIDKKLPWPEAKHS